MLCFDKLICEHNNKKTIFRFVGVYFKNNYEKNGKNEKNK